MHRQKRFYLFNLCRIILFKFVLRRYRSGNDFNLNGKEEVNDLMNIQPHLDDAVAPYVVTTANGTAKVSLSGAMQLVSRL
jgi:hypothetical protein